MNNNNLQNIINNINKDNININHKDNTMDYCYTLKDFEFPVENVLTEETLRIIRELCLSIGHQTESTTYVNQYNTSASSNHRNVKDNDYKGDKFYNRNNVKKPLAQDNWKGKSGFKVTKFAIVNDHQAIINDIRVAMNKLTDVNREEKISTIIGKMNEINEMFEDEDNEVEKNEQINKALTTIYAISITNKMLTDTYVKVWMALYSEFNEAVSKVFELKLSEYKATMQNIVDVSSDNYDEFCDFTTKNTLRKNTTTLLCELARAGSTLFKEENMIILLDDLMNQIDGAIELKDKQKEVEELTESVVIIFSKIKSNEKLFAGYLPRLQVLAGYKNGDKPGLAARSKFKYMDLVGK